MTLGGRGGAILLTAGFVGLAGCTASVDTRTLEQQIKDELARQSGVVPVSVQCPDDVSAEAGGTFECTAEADDGSVATITVTQQDDEGNVQWEVTRVE